jgi:hypothetical protein
VKEEIFLWPIKVPYGISGGILIGVDQQIFDIGSIDEGYFYVNFQLCNKLDGFKWALVVVYAPAQPAYKENF